MFVVAPFTRGYAPSPVPEDDAYDPDTRAMDVVHLIEALGRKQAVVIGHDWGALTVYRVLELAPQYVRKAVAVAVPHPSVFTSLLRTLRVTWTYRHGVTLLLPGAAARFRRRDYAALRTLYERWSPNFKWSDAMLEHAKNALAGPENVKAALAYYRGRYQLALKRRGPPTHVPGLLIGCLDDPAFKETDYEACKPLFSGDFRVAMVPGGHFAHLEHPDAFFEAIAPFVLSD
jgi:pimeloyl-ACP methyl ester carboxylesterase